MADDLIAITCPQPPSRPEGQLMHLEFEWGEEKSKGKFSSRFEHFCHASVHTRLRAIAKLMCGKWSRRGVLDECNDW